MPLDRKEDEALRRFLEARKRELMAELHDDIERSREDNLANQSAPAGDAGDESVAELLAHLDQFDASRDVGELRAIDAALRRIDEGAYGRCEECGSDIGYERLKASPTAIRCIVCQRQYEKTHASPSTPTL